MGGACTGRGTRSIGHWGGRQRGRWLAGLRQRGRCGGTGRRLLDDGAVPSAVARAVEVRLLEESAQARHQAFLDGAQRLTLVLVAGAPRLGLHLLVSRL